MISCFFLLLLTLAPAHAQTGADDELLPADDAFALTTRVVDSRTIEAQWKIAPGYYMYRDKFRFELLDGGSTQGKVALQAAQLPAGKKKEDPSFGTVETYTKSVVARVPLERTGDTAQTIRVRITAQGCNEPIGVCYPPVKKEVSFSLPAITKPGASLPGVEKGVSTLSREKGTDPFSSDPFSSGIESLLGLGGGQQEFLPVDQAFRPFAETRPDGTIAVRIAIAPGYYLYRDKLKFELIGPAGAVLGTYDLPTGKPKEDPHFGTVQVYYNEASATLPVSGAPLAGGAGALKASFQGCAEKGICYPPTTRTLEFLIPAAQAGDAAGGEGDAAGGGRAVLYAGAIVGAFGIGLLLSFTPCVLPMIPILSSAIVGASDRRVTKLDGGLLSAAYVLGTATTYTAVGVLAGATGQQLQAYLQNPWAIGTFAALLAALAAAMFGLYELQLPAFIQTHLHHHSHHAHARLRHVRGGAYMGLYFMGLISALIVGACVSPLLISALGVSIANRDPLLGGLIMFAMALGMGAILIAVGVGLGSLLPKTGAWMDRIKHIFGVLILAVAIFLLGLLPQVPVLLLWAALLIVTGVYLGATQSLPQGANGWRYLWKGFGTLLLIWGIAALVGGFAGERDIMRPLPDWTRARTATATQAAEGNVFQRFATLAQIETALDSARAQGKPAILDFYATWCTDCIRMEKGVFTDARVRERLKDLVLVQADVTENDANARAIKDRFGVFGPPAMLIFGADGQETRALRFYGYKSADAFVAHLEAVGQN